MAAPGSDWLYVRWAIFVGRRGRARWHLALPVFFSAKFRANAPPSLKGLLPVTHDCYKSRQERHFLDYWNTCSGHPITVR
jgi:hypothetical protein